MTLPTGAHGSATAAVDLAAATAGDAEAFHRLTQPSLRELHLHCYRMLGSIQDAEDALQETVLRAWRHLASFAGRSTFRSWLYRIATNVCLTAAARQHVAPPAPGWLADALATSSEPVIHLSPYPDAWLDELEAASGNPVAHYELRESVELAFLAAVQVLPPRQRAVLILRDVLTWSASEVAELLGATTVSVNSALQRARATIARQRREGRLRTDLVVPTDAVEESLVRRYIDAWEAADMDGFVALLRSDAVLTMPPLPLRYVGRPAIASFFALIPRGSLRPSLRLTASRANRQPVGASPFLVGLLVASYAAAQVVGAPLIGRFSDRYGRRPALLITICCNAVGFFVFGLANSLPLLFAGRILSGISGGNLAVAQSYVVDITDAQHRARGLGMIGAAFGIGFVIGPLLGGALSVFGYGVPARVAGGLSALNCIAAFAFLTESLTPARRTDMRLKAQPRTAFALNALLDALKHPQVGPLLNARLFFAFAFNLFITIFPLYAQSRLGLNAPQIGFVFAYVGVLLIIVQAVLVGRMVADLAAGEILASVEMAAPPERVFYALASVVSSSSCRSHSTRI